MTRKERAVVRYLAIQCVLSVAVGLTLGIAMLTQNIARISTLASTPADVLIFLIGSVMTFFPLVFATAVGLLHHDNAG